jgi:hypothetical protein
MLICPRHPQGGKKMYWKPPSQGSKGQVTHDPSRSSNGDILTNKKSDDMKWGYFSCFISSYLALESFYRW